MNRQIIEQHLRQARAHVALGEHHLDRQKVLICKLERDGHDATMARTVLSTFEQSQKIHVEEVARLEGELDTGDVA